jgi:hypothetical protein
MDHCGAPTDICLQCVLAMESHMRTNNDLDMLQPYDFKRLKTY